ncbi:MAG TPA: hypothetical protein VMJ92_03180, partial [Candidatus Limnocylindrales bacterium]|nr:hypothetical protein [Candidatus Limnocylindrales bacterium]
YDKVMPLATERYRSKYLTGQYADVAKALGAHAERIEQPGEIAQAIERAARITMEGRPAVLEFITREDTEKSTYFKPVF